MDEVQPFILVCVSAVLLILNIIFSLGGGAFEEITEADMEDMEEDRRLKTVEKLLDDTYKLRVLIRTVRILSLLFIGVFAIYPLDVFLKSKLTEVQYGNVIFIIVYIVVLFAAALIMLTFGIMLPERIAARKPAKWAFGTAGFLSVMSVLFKPFTALNMWLTKGFGKAFGVPVNFDVEEVTEDDIMSIVIEGHEQGILETKEADMISNIFDFDDKEACDIMTHRKNMVAIDSESTVEEASRIMLDDRYTRYPLYDEDIDDIIGILYFKDIMRIQTSGKTDVELKSIAREPFFVPETQSINTLLREMQKKKNHMAIVIDEYGQTAGLVAMEDILEEIVGNILDEYDVDEKFIQNLPGKAYLIKGMTMLEDVEEVLDIEFEEEDFDTLNGFLISRLSHIPAEGDHSVVEYGGYSFQVMKVSDNIIQSVRVKKEDD